MGASESTRKLTIINEDSDGSIKITDAVARRLVGEVQQSTNAQQQDAGGQLAPRERENAQLFAAPMETLTLRKRHEEQLSRLEASWQSQKKILEQQNRKLWSDTTTRIAQDLTGIEQKYLKKRRYDPICPEKETKVEDCYRSNLATPLKCSEQVKDFVGCINIAKRAALINGEI